MTLNPETMNPAFQIINFAFILILSAILFTGCDNTLDSNQEIEEEEEEIERSYSKTIEREYNSEFEAELIAKAEAAYPPRDSVIAATREHLREHVPETGYWYLFSFDGILIPYAITSDAIDYYSDLIDAMQAGVTHQHIKYADFQYQVQISFKEVYEFSWPPPMEANGPYTPPQPEDFENVYVVKMTLNWNHRRVVHSVMYLEHGRIVVFNEDGTLKRIFLDGRWPLIAS